MDVGPSGRRVWIRTAALAVALAFVSACSSNAGSSGSEGSGSGSPTKIVFAGPTLVPPSVSNITESVAADGGYFKRNNLDVEFKQTAGSPLAVAALKSGSAQFAAANMSVLATSDAEGANLEMVCAFTFRFPGMVVANSKVTSVSQLADGKHIVGQTASGSTDYNVVVALARSQGLDASKIHFATTGNIANSAQYIIGGRIDATWLNFPSGLSTIAKAQEKGVKLHALVDPDALEAAYPDYGGVVLTSKPYADSHKDVVTRVCKSVIQANRALAADQSTLNNIVNKLLPGQYTQQQLDTIWAAYKSAYGANGGLNKEALEGMENTWKKYVNPEAANNKYFSSFSELVDPQFVQAAVKQLGGPITSQADAEVGGGGSL